MIIVSVFIMLMMYFAFHKPELNLRGDWDATKIVINGKDFLTSDPLYGMISFGRQVQISDFKDSIGISTFEYNAHAAFEIKKDKYGNRQIILSSREKSFNGNFDLKIDTTHFGPQEYRVNVKINSYKTHIYFQRLVSIPQWKPEFPSRKP